MIKNLLFYLIYIVLTVLIFLIDSYFGLLLATFSYFLLFLLNYLKNKTIFNYLQFYLLTCWILTLSQIFNIYTFGNDFFYNEKLYFLYCIIITGIITFFFKVPDKNIYLFKTKFNKITFRNFYPTLVILFFILIFIFDGSFGSVLQYFIKNLLYISPILVASILYLNSKKKTLPLLIFVITFYYYTSFTFNRTGFILVPIIFFLTVLIDKKFEFKLKENLKNIFLSIIFFSILLVIGDLYKTSQTRNLIDFISELKFYDLYNYFELTRYKFGTESNIYDYFYIIQALTDDNRELGGNIFSQFIGIFTPRYFFPDKVLTNISELNYVQGIVETHYFLRYS